MGTTTRWCGPSSVDVSPHSSHAQIDFRETMPAAGNETMYIHSADPTASTVGGLAVGVPGEIRGWELLHSRHGKLPWKRLFEPAIHVARNGFEVNVDLANFLSSASHRVPPEGALLLMDMQASTHSWLKTRCGRRCTRPMAHY